mmetsp:Transcript_72779/g.137646  ORF Transcript_72779/g.137646 Transcript_72779/m.137646 type:complete len:540 (+) Transcript_72779:42-1661(+)
MHKSAIVLICLVRTSYERRVHLHSSPLAESQKSVRSAEDSPSLANLLLAFNSAAAFHPSAPGARLQKRSPTLPDLPLGRHEPVRAAAVATVEKEEKEATTIFDKEAVPVAENEEKEVFVKPGQKEKEQFKCDPTCKYWEEYRQGSTPTPLEDVQKAAAIVAKYFPSGGTAAADYWAKHAARTSYFLANAVAGTLSFRFFGERPPGSDGGGLANSSISELGSLATRLLLESVLTYEQDWQRISKGVYKQPWDMTLGHRQYELPYMLDKSARFVKEAVGTLERRSRAQPEDRQIWLGSSNSMYPDYYKTNYHYQTDGWMSADSAAVYETSTETLFLGRQDAMQRLSLIPLQGLKGEGGRPLKILEVACGTGRFATFIRDNHPDAEVTCVDLSPYYLEAARENDEYWRQFKSRNGGEVYPPATFVQAAAENLPFEAESFDAVVCVYLFHEMPEGPRAAAAAEMARVVKPGGVVVLTDSQQLGDRPASDPYIANFEKLNEPHYPNYIKTNIGDLYTKHGLECAEKHMASASKMLSFTKPKSEP